MSEVRYRVCDHCGKRIDGMKDYEDYSITRFSQADLCTECFEELEKMIRAFLHRKDVIL